ncbi:DUF5954 family protein [Streptomyces sp. NPDC056144]|uniref:DUF5954 family protein n=1 Tax=unclassified Streptomyces TaxID=2593676 RepID=UPI0035E180CB
MSDDAEWTGMGAGAWPWPVLVREPVEPVETLLEAERADAARRHTGVAVRGPLFGVAANSESDGLRWRVVIAVNAGCPQLARDSLNSLFWFRAKDEAKDRAERRALLAAVARLETERVDELTVLGTRYRVVRAEEYARVDAHGRIEAPRPTDPVPRVISWNRADRGPEIDEGLVVDPEAPVSPLQAAERLGMRSLAYTAKKFPRQVREDSARAVESHPDVVMMPAAFLVVEKAGKGNWTPSSGLHATAHDARKSLDFSFTWMEPRRRGLIPFDTDPHADARSIVAENSSEKAGELAAYVAASDRLREGVVDEIELHGTVYRIGRSRRLLRWGPDGPEGPRPSDVNSQDPMAMHPHMDEDGVIHRESSGSDSGEDDSDDD